MLGPGLLQEFDLVRRRDAEAIQSKDGRSHRHAPRARDHAFVTAPAERRGRHGLKLFLKMTTGGVELKDLPLGGELKASGSRVDLVRQGPGDISLSLLLDLHLRQGTRGLICLSLRGNLRHSVDLCAVSSQSGLE